MIRSRSYDYVFLDLIIPGISGLEVMKTMRDEGIETPVIVITADMQDTTHQECLALGVAAVINKPREKYELMDAIKRVLSKRSGL